VAQYVQELGEEVAPYVVPSAKLLAATLDTLPSPELNDADKDEKIELGE
jgi:probable lipoprotein (TIGR04455 family)